MTIKITERRAGDDDIRRALVALNFSEQILPFCVGPPAGVGLDAAGSDFGGFSVDRSIFRFRFPDDRWLLYAAGLVDPKDADGVTLQLQYVKNDGTSVLIGAPITLTGLGPQKATLGPFDLFATAGVPNGEQVVAVRLFGAKVNTGMAIVRDWVIWLRLLCPKV